MTAAAPVLLDAKSYPGWQADSDGNVYFNGELKPGGYTNGRVRVWAPGRVPLSRSVLVCTAWHGPKPFPKAKVLHKDDVPDNDHPSNLYWGTDSDNRQDAITNGIHSGGHLTDEDVIEIKKRYASGKWSQRDLGYIYGVSGATICRAINDYPGRH